MQSNSWKYLLSAWESSFQKSDQRSGMNIVVDLVCRKRLRMNVRMQIFSVFTGTYTVLELTQYNL